MTEKELDTDYKERIKKRKELRESYRKSLDPDLPYHKVFYAALWCYVATVPAKTRHQIGLCYIENKDVIAKTMIVNLLCGGMLFARTPDEAKTIIADNWWDTSREHKFHDVKFTFEDIEYTGFHTLHDILGG